MRWFGPAAAFVLLASLAMADSYVASIEKWRQEYVADLEADDGWLTLAGLFWLKPGANSFGTDESNDIVFPPGTAAAKAGVLEFQDGRVTMRQGGSSKVRKLKSDVNEDPTIVKMGRLRFHVIKRGERYGIRLKDSEGVYRKQFTGQQWFPVKPEYRVTAEFHEFPSPKTLKVPSIIGGTEEYTSPGYAEFTLNGRKCRLQPALEDDELFFIFKDTSAGKSTYPAGRFLYTELPKSGKVVIDFNKAYNPPCAFTPYATCPLPPRQNRLDVAIEAGAKNYHHD